MIVSYNLLKEYVDLKDYTLQQICDKLTLAGFEIEGIKQLSSGTNLIIGEVLECYDHPNSDHLHVTKTSIGNETFQIVCGAPNCRKGLKVIVALPGANLPAKGIVIQKGEIRGVESNGMLCSLLELGVDEDMVTGPSKNGIEELPSDAVVGDTNPLQYLNLDDTIIDISVTPNRADVLGLEKLFKEIAAILETTTIKELDYSVKRSGKSEFSCKSSTSNCDYFSMTTITGVKVKPSPIWMQHILSKHGIKCINNIVDIGNYVTLMTGQPLHMYDALKLSCKTFDVHDDYETEVVALDDKTYQINKGDLVITNNKEVVCIAGVIGAKSTMIDEKTNKIALEVALFNGPTILNSAKKYGIMTVAATNYSKNAVDRYKVLFASDMACNLLVKYANAKHVSAAHEYDKRKLKEKKIKLSLSFVNKRLGSNYNIEQVCNVFSRLGFSYSFVNNNMEVVVPTYRNDISIKEDLLEEIIRLIGYDTIGYELPNISCVQNGLTETQKVKTKIMNYLLDLGLTNTLSYTLINKQQAEYYDVFDKNTYIVLPHPLTVEKQYLRKNMICSMLNTISYNQARGTKEVSIFEISQVYSNEHLDGEEKLSIAISNGFRKNKWLGNEQVDYYMIKGIVEGLMAICGIEPNRYSFERLSNTYPSQKIFHPGKSAILKINGKEIGVLGEIHPTTISNEGIDPTIYFEMNMSMFNTIKTGKIKYSAVSKYPTVTRDIAMIVKEDLAITTIIKTMKKVGGSLLTNVDVFDVYQGEHVSKGYKSVALTMNFNDPTKTLTEEVINELFNKIYNQCVVEFGAKLR